MSPKFAKVKCNIDTFLIAFVSSIAQFRLAGKSLFVGI